MPWFLQKHVNLLAVSANSCEPEATGYFPLTPLGNSSFGRAWSRTASRHVISVLHRQLETGQDPVPPLAAAVFMSKVFMNLGKKKNNEHFKAISTLQDEIPSKSQCNYLAVYKTFISWIRVIEAGGYNSCLSFRISIKINQAP